MYFSSEVEITAQQID